MQDLTSLGNPALHMMHFALMACNGLNFLLGINHLEKWPCPVIPVPGQGLGAGSQPGGVAPVAGFIL
jgi:hypothetical protein